MAREVGVGQQTVASDVLVALNNSLRFPELLAQSKERGQLPARGADAT
jgi:hypothetical protein